MCEMLALERENVCGENLFCKKAFPLPIAVPKNTAALRLLPCIFRPRLSAEGT